MNAAEFAFDDDAFGIDNSLAEMSQNNFLNPQISKMHLSQNMQYRPLFKPTSHISTMPLGLKRKRESFPGACSVVCTGLVGCGHSPITANAQVFPTEPFGGSNVYQEARFSVAQSSAAGLSTEPMGPYTLPYHIGQ